MSVREVNTARIQSLKGYSHDLGSTAQKFTDTDSTPLAGISSANTYDYSIVVTGDTTALYKVKLVGKVGSNTSIKTAEIEVFHDEVESKLLTNIRTGQIRFEAFRVYSAPSTTFTLRIANDFSDTFYFSIYAEGFLYDKALSGFSGAETRGMFGNRGVFGAGYDPTAGLNVIEYIAIDTPSTVTDFGDLTSAKYAPSALSDGSRGIFGGGTNAPSYPLLVDIDYITISTPGNAADFGDLTAGRYYGASDSDGSRGVFAGGGYPAIDVIDYITISTTGNAADFGNLSLVKRNAAMVSNGSRGLIGGGTITGGTTNAIEYITIATPGNSLDFGDLSYSSAQWEATSDGSRGVWGGGPSNGDKMVYVEISTQQDSSTFGVLTDGRTDGAGTSNGSRGVFGGGDDGYVKHNIIDYFAIAVPANAVDWGDLSAIKRAVRATSGA